MPLPAAIARQLTAEQIAFVNRSGLRAEMLEPGHVRPRMPLAGNQNHIGSMYADALFTLAETPTLAEIPGGALLLTSFDSQRFYPANKEMNLRFAARPWVTSMSRLDSVPSRSTGCRARRTISCWSCD